MPEPTYRFGVVLIITLCLLWRSPMGSAVSRVKAIERSIDLTGNSLGNTIQHQEASQFHPHEALGKPSKFDLNAGPYTEADDESPAVPEGPHFKNDAIKDKQITTVATKAFEENNGQLTKVSNCSRLTISVKCLERISSYLRTVSSVYPLKASESVQIVKKKSLNFQDELKNVQNIKNISLIDKVYRLARSYVVKIKLWNDLLLSTESRTFFGTFGLKKLLLPLFIGAQIIKSILIALFLPSIIGSIGKIVGKGVTSFAQFSQNPEQMMEEAYEFKENQDLYNEDYMLRQPLGTLPASAMYNESVPQTKGPDMSSRYSFADTRLTGLGELSDRYYLRNVINPQTKRQDFKVFQEIPTSSLLLTKYDPFYSPLLSRLDTVFSRLGHHSEDCREYAVCAMYRSPARYAPYSNLVSAQLSRELNELRKPSSDNTDVLRFFRYMKAAKDGQDGLRCEEIYQRCEDLGAGDQGSEQNKAMLATYQDIDKLVHARKA